MKQKIVYFILAVLVLMGGNAMADIKYSRHHQAFLRLILNRQPGQAVLELKNYLKNHPGDAEAYYSLVLAHAQMGHPDRSIESIKRGLELGLDLVRFLAGPRFLLNPIEETAFMQKLGKDYLNKPIHGPMIGSVTESSARFWIRTLKEANVQIRVSRSANIESAVSSPKVKTLHSSDYTARLRVEGLESNTRYYYWVVINDSVSTPFQQFKTFPKSGTPGMDSDQSETRYLNIFKQTKLMASFCCQQTDIVPMFIKYPGQRDMISMNSNRPD
jgi:alkaline phosphatase D